MFNQNVELVGPYASSAAGAAGSSSYSFSIPSAGLYSIDWKLSLPSLSQGGGTSGAIVRIRNTTTATTLLTATAGAPGGKLDFTAAADDVIQFNISSVTAADLVSLNTVKAQIAISSGV